MSSGRDTVSAGPAMGTLGPRHGSGYKWTILGVGIVAQAAMSTLQHGLSSLGPALRNQFGLSLAEVGIVLASANWGIMATLLFWGWLADRIGERRVIVIGLGGSALALVLASFCTGVVQLGLTLASAGGFGASAAAASGRAVMSWFPRNQRGFALGLRQMAVPLGGASAAVALPIIDKVWGLPGGMLALAAAAGVGALAAGLWLAPPPCPPSDIRIEGLPGPIRDPAIWRLATCTGLMGCAQVAHAAFVVIFLVEHRGFSPAQGAMVLAAIQIGGGLIRVASGRWSDRSGRRMPMIRQQGLLLVITLFAVAALTDGPLPLLLAALVVSGVLTLGWNGLAFTVTTELAGHARAGLAIGLQGTVMRAISSGAGVAFGLTAAATSWSVAFAALALMPCAGWMLMAPLPAEELHRSHPA